MSGPFVMPRSGIWMVRSRSDRRWNLRGQYSSSDWWDPSASNRPPEAIDAVEHLRGSLGANPPEDLTCVYVAYPTGKLKRLFESSVLMATERQGALDYLTRECGLSIVGLDRDQGEVWFGEPGREPAHRFSAQALGMLDEGASIWQWAWVSEETGGLNPRVFQSARTLHEYGTKHEVSELTYEQVALGVKDDRPWFNASYLSKIACRLCDADFVIAGGSSALPNLRELWLVKAPGILPQPESISNRVFHVIKEAVDTWGSGLSGAQAEKAVLAFADQRGCTVSDWGGREIGWAPEGRQVSERRIRIVDPSGDCIYIDFDATGHISGLACPPPSGPPPAKPSWLKRFFGQTKDQHG